MECQILQNKIFENGVKSVISQIRTISAGESVGYGRKFMAEKQRLQQFHWLCRRISRGWGMALDL
jgi:alanine racemase